MRECVRGREGGGRWKITRPYFILLSFFTLVPFYLCGARLLSSLPFAVVAVPPFCHCCVLVLVLVVVSVAVVVIVILLFTVVVAALVG